MYLNNETPIRFINCAIDLVLIKSSGESEGANRVKSFATLRCYENGLLSMVLRRNWLCTLIILTSHIRTLICFAGIRVNNVKFNGATQRR